MSSVFHKTETSGTIIRFGRDHSAESVASDSALGYERGSTPSLSLRRRGTRPLNSVPSSPTTHLQGSAMFRRGDRESVPRPLDVKPFAINPLSVKPLVINPSAGFTGHGSRRRSQTSPESLGAASDDPETPLETSLSVTIDSLRKERRRTCQLTTELHNMQKEYEYERRRRDEVSAELRRLTTIVEEIIASARAPSASSNERKRRVRPLSDSVGARLDWIQKLYLTYIDDMRSTFPDHEAADEPYVASVRRRLSQSLGSSAEISRTSSTKSSKGSTSELLQDRLGGGSGHGASSSQRDTSQAQAESTSHNASHNASHRTNLDTNADANVDTSLNTNPSTSQEQSDNSSLPFRDGSSPGSSLRTIQFDNEADSSVFEEGDGLFCYIPGSAEAAASALSRPLSTAQANRHSAIIGDNLLSLSFALPPADDDFEVPLNLTAETSNSTTASFQEPLTPATDDFTQDDDSTAAKAVSLAVPLIVTSARPSEDAPTMSCRVGRTFDNPLGSGYISRKIAPNKAIMGRSSVAAYQRR